MTLVNDEIITVSGISSTSQLNKKGELVTVFEPITVKRFFLGVDDLTAWRQQIEAGILVTQDITITMMNAAFTDVREINIFGAWPSGIKIPSMEADGSDAATEEFIFTFDYAVEVAVP